MHTMGDDFQFTNATKNFVNMDKAVNFVNLFSFLFGVEVIYSTPSRYLKEIN